MQPDPVIVVPGITATYLDDHYRLPPDTVWSVLKKDYERSALHPDDLRYEALEPAAVRPGQVFEVAYKELIEELRFNLTERPDREVPVYWFGYDWRQPLEASEERLAQFIEEVISRTALTPHYGKTYAERKSVTLVGHSMGGLLIAGYLARHGPEGRVSKVVTLATPFQGSFEAPAKIVTGTAELGDWKSVSREREAARVTPALYYLIPSIPGSVVDAEDNDVDLLDPDAWQDSVFETIASFIERHSVDRGNKTSRLDRARALVGDFLTRAKEHRSRSDELDLESCGLTSSDWLCVAGVDCETRVEIKVRLSRGQPVFDLSSKGRKNNWNFEGDAPVGDQTGDGTVPFKGAVPSFLPYESLVCIRPGDFGYWEVADSVLSRAAGFHGILPNMNMLHRLIVRHITGRSDKYGNTWGRPAPGVQPSEWKPPVKNLEWKQDK